MRNIVGFILVFFIYALGFSQVQNSLFFYDEDAPAVGGERKHEIVLQSSQVPSTDQTDFPVLITLDNLDTEVVDLGVNSAEADGSDIIFTSDLAGSNRLAVDIIQFTASATAGDRRCTIFVKVPTLANASNTSIYVWYNEPLRDQPASDAAFGSEAVWSAFTVASLDGYTNRVDNTTLTAVTSGTTTTASNPFGTADFPLMDFDSDELYYADVSGYDPSGGTTYYSWFNYDTPAQFERILNLTVDAADDCQLQLTHQGAVSATRIGAGYEVSVGFISSGNTTTSDGHASGSWHFAGGNTGDTDDINLFMDGTFTAFTSDGATSLSSGSTGQQRFYIGGRSDDSSNYDGRVMAFLLEGDKGEDWIETAYNNQSSPATFGIEQTPQNAN